MRPDPFADARRMGQPLREIRRDGNESPLRRLGFARTDFDEAFAPFQIRPRKPEQFLGAHARKRLERNTGRGFRRRRMQNHSKLRRRENLDVSRRFLSLANAFE